MREIATAARHHQLSQNIGDCIDITVVNGRCRGMFYDHRNSIDMKGLVVHVGGVLLIRSRLKANLESAAPM
jgi:hypothetical protein